MAGEATKRRRERFARLLRDTPDVSDRAAGREMGVHHTTIARDRLALAERAGVHRPPAPERGNARALVHGVYSEARIAPLRAGYEDELAARYDWITEAEIKLQAQRLAMIEAAIADIDANGIVHPDAHSARDLADRVSKWSATAEAWYERRRAEARDRTSAPQNFNAVVAEVAAEQDDSEPEQGATDADA